MENNTWIKLFRKFKEWEWYKDNNTKSLFIEILLSTNFKDKKWQGIVIHRGEFITSIEKLGNEIGLTRQQVRYSLNKLKVTNEVTIQTNKHFTLIKVNKFNDYQEVTNQLTNNEPSINHPVTTTKELKNIRNKEITTYLSSFNEKFKTKYQPTSERIKKLNLRLKIFTLEEILKALDNLSKSEFHQGTNDRGWKADADFLIRSDEQVDKWLNSKPKINHLTYTVYEEPNTNI